MPRLTDARKELRRTQITEAAVGCFSRDGLERTSIADITAESGLSTGSIYAHYRSKDDLVRASAHALLAKRAEALGQYAASDSPPDPDELLARLIATIDPAEARVGVQTWGEATTNPAIRAIVADTVDRMRAMVLDCVTAHPGQGRRPRPGPRPGARHPDRRLRDGALPGRTAAHRPAATDRGDGDMTSPTAPFTDRTVLRDGYGARQLERLHHRRGEAVAVAASLGVTPSRVGLAWPLHHAPNVLLIPGTANAAHLEANIAAGEITLDAADLAALDAVESRSNDVPIG